MTFNRQWYWGGSLVLLLTIVLLVVVQTSADESPAEAGVPEQPYNSLELAKMTAQQRAQVIERMSLTEKESLRKKWKQFKGLDENVKPGSDNCIHRFQRIRNQHACTR